MLKSILLKPEMSSGMCRWGWQKRVADGLALKGCTRAGWSWSTHAASLLPAAGSMQAGLPATTADGQRDSWV